MSIQPEQSTPAEGGFPIGELIEFHNAWVDAYNEDFRGLKDALEREPDQATSDPALFARGRIVRDAVRLGAFRQLLESYGVGEDRLEAMLNQQESEEQ